MKKEDIDRTKEGELEKVTGFQYVSGSICRLSDDDDEPVITSPELKESIDKGVVACPRCEGGMELRQDGKWWCPKDGLVLTEAVKKKFNL